jgi:phosphatidylserine/phosphatidylglycerophosphate/cardiolipin synthase-like enzyme
MHLMYLLAITAATRTIDLSNAYFVPDDWRSRRWSRPCSAGCGCASSRRARSSIRTCARRLARGWGELLEAGVKISEYQPTMFHCKALVVDGLLVSVGSTNFDNRSFSLNDEANLNVYDEAFAAEQTVQFEADLRVDLHGVRHLVQRIAHHGEPAGLRVCHAADHADRHPQPVPHNGDSRKSQKNAGWKKESEAGR